MRRFLFMALLLAGTGCQSLRDGHHCDECRKRPGGLLKRLHADCEPKKPCVEKKEVAKPPEKVAAPKVEAPPPVQTPAIAQDILLIPKTVYIPYAPQTPVGPVRLTSTHPVGVPPQEEQPRVTAPTPKECIAAPKDIPCETTRQMLDICKKLNHRLDCLEQKLHDRAVGPTMVQPCPPTPFFPLLRRPLFNRCDPLESCEPSTPANPKAAPEKIASPNLIP